MADRIGLYNTTGSSFFLRNDLANGIADTTFGFGAAPSTSTALTGDWDGVGADGVGLYNPATGTFFLSNGLTQATVNTGVTTLQFGPATSDIIPLVGDWDGNGTDTVGLYRVSDGVFFLSNGTTQATVNTGVSTIQFGPAGTDIIPLVGDWDSNGTDTVGLYRVSDGAFFLSNGTTQATVNTGVTSFLFGAPGAGIKPLVGDWDGNGSDTVGLYNSGNGAFFTTNGSTQATVNTGVTSFFFGPGGTDWNPLVGEWVAPAPTFTLTAASTTVNEGSALTFTVTLSAAQATATTVTFQLKPGDAAAANAGTTNTNLQDFAGGAFNPVTVTIPAGSTTGTFTTSPVSDGITEFAEAFSVEATIGGVTKSLGATVLDGAISGGQTYTLTTGPDNITGTPGNDTINGYYNQTAASTDSTLTAVDVIRGGEGIDTLNLTTAGAPTTLNGADIQGVEILNLRASANTGSIALNVISGLTEFNSDRSVGTVTATELNAGAAVGLKGDGSTILGAVAVSYVATATSATLNISGGVGPTGTTAPAVTVAGTAATTATINSTGAANKIGALALGTANTVTAATVNATTNLTTGAITAGALQTLTITGAGAVTLGAATDTLATTVTSINASANTGGVTVGSGHKQTAFTGGSGADKLTIGTVVYDASAKIAGGAGTADILAIADHTSVVFTTAAKANISGFEILEVGGSGKTYDFTALTGLTGLNIAAATSATIDKLGAATPVTITGDQTTGLTVNVADATNPLNTADSLTLTLDKAGTANATSIVTVADLTSNGLETLNIVSSGLSTANTTAGTDDNVITTLVGLSTSNVNLINISGASDLNLTTGAINKIVNIVGTTATGNLTIDASGNNSATGLQGGSGADAMIGTTVADVLKGNGGADRLITGISAGTAAADNLTGGAGADKFVFTGTSAANTLKGSSDTVTAKITDFSYTDGDKIELSQGVGTAAQILAGTTQTAITPGALGNSGLIVAANLGAAAAAAAADTNQVTSGAQALAASAATFFNWNDGTTTRAFVIVNDGTAAYASGTDMVIELTGITLKSGDAALGSLTVADYFA